MYCYKNSFKIFLYILYDILLKFWVLKILSLV